MIFPSFFFHLLFNVGLTCLMSVGQNREDWNQTRRMISTGWSSISSATVAGRFSKYAREVPGSTCKIDSHNFRKFQMADLLLVYQIIKSIIHRAIIAFRQISSFDDSRIQIELKYLSSLISLIICRYKRTNYGRNRWSC